MIPSQVQFIFPREQNGKSSLHVTLILKLVLTKGEMNIYICVHSASAF